MWLFEGEGALPVPELAHVGRIVAFQTSGFGVEVDTKGGLDPI